MKSSTLPKATQLDFYETNSRQTVVAKPDGFTLKAAAFLLPALVPLFFSAYLSLTSLWDLFYASGSLSNAAVRMSIAIGMALFGFLISKAVIDASFCPTLLWIEHGYLYCCRSGVLGVTLRMPTDRRSSRSRQFFTSG